MIIWKGAGILNLVIIGVAILLSKTVDNAIYGSDSKGHFWITIIFYILAGILIWFLGKALNKNRNNTVVNPETGHEYRIGTRHSLFFIPMQYWGPIVIILGLISPFFKK
ncbi:MAG: hypothetical protein N2645_19020 [Clostridia bacterium]|nr:hypothetical protein [Clostridia bacterium]